MEKPTDPSGVDVNRREFLQGAMAASAVVAMGDRVPAALERLQVEAVVAQIPKQHAATVKALQDWIALPSIAAENRNYPQGPEYMAKLAREAGFQQVELMPTKAGQAGVFATLDAGAKTWLAVYFMYDVKQFDPAEWTSPPLEARIVDKPGFGKVVVGRGAENSKGPQMALLAALHAFKGAQAKLPVNLVLVCEGQEEIGSPDFKEIVFAPRVAAALTKCIGIVIPGGSQAPDGSVQIELGAKGVVELELVSTGEKWGRGPKKDVHSSLEAQVDSPVWHLVQALNTLVKEDGHTPAVEGFFDKVRPMTPQETRILDAALPKFNEADIKKSLGVSHWYKDEPFKVSQARLVSQPTINVEGLVAGYTGPGGGGAHAPDEYWVVESSNPKVAGMDGAVRSFVELFFAMV